MPTKVIFVFVAASCVAAVWIVVALYRELLKLYTQSETLNSSEYSWFFHLLLNVIGYSIVLIPLAITYKYVNKTKYFDKISKPTIVYRVLFACFGDHGVRLPETDAPAEKPQRDLPELAFCFTGLMAAYLVWGLLQEKIMTQQYILPDGTVAKFEDSQFLVFVNRLLALVIAVMRLLCSGQPLVGAPLYKLSYCSLSNVLSAWCQYEALKYVSFPLQVLSKSCKVLPVMAMGKLVSGNKYELYEYVTAASISAGMVLFMLGTRDDYVAVGASLAGMCLLVLYLASDSFTSSWQSAVLVRHQLAPLQLLAAVNLFSCLLTAGARALQPPVLQPALLQNPVFLWDVVLLSGSSALGQLLIYRTIARFGAITFTIIMTLRQAVSILLSCLVYGHHISVSGGFGIFLVFSSVFLRVYCRQRLKKRRPATV